MRCCICETVMEKVERVSCAKEAIKVFDIPHKIAYEEVMLFRCPNCSHMSIENCVKNDVYEDEYNVDYSSWELTQKMDEYFLGKMCSLLDRNDNVLEIGCGEGRTLGVASTFFNNVYGIEPATRQAELAKKRVEGVIINDFFTPKSTLPVKFDAFYSKMVFEHLINPLQILKNVYEYLMPGGVGWINVPNGQKIFNENMYELFSFVHIQYYTPLSINFMLAKAGFEIVELDTHEDMEGEIVEIDVLFKKAEKTCGKFEEQKKIDIDFIKKNISFNDIVTIWGAGTKAHKYIELFDYTNNIKHIIDRNEEKKGKYISKLNIPIEAVSKEIIKESDVIFIFASMYNEDILRTLKIFGFKGKILLFEDGKLKLRQFI